MTGYYLSYIILKMNKRRFGSVYGSGLNKSPSGTNLRTGGDMTFKLIRF